MKKKGINFIVLFAMVFLCVSLSQAAEANNETLKQNLVEVDAKLANPVSMPSWLENVLNTIFRLGEEPLTVSFIIILLAVSSIFALTLMRVIEFTPFFDSRTLSIPVAILTTLLIALSGAIKSFALFMTNGFSFFNILETYNAGALSFALLLLFLVGFILNYIFKRIKQVQATAMKKEAGRQVGGLLGYIKTQMDWFDFTKKIMPK